jgi:hypothetical protein
MQYYFIDARKWFTGPKITLDGSEISEAQEQAFKSEGLDVNIIDGDGTPASLQAVATENKIATV